MSLLWVVVSVLLWFSSPVVLSLPHCSLRITWSWPCWCWAAGTCCRCQYHAMDCYGHQKCGVQTSSKFKAEPKNVVFFPIETQKCRVFSNRRIFQSQSFGVVKFWREQPSKMLILPAKKKVYQPTTWNDSQYPDGFFWKNMQWPEISEWSLLPGMVSWLYCLPKIPKISIIIIYLDVLPHRFIIFCSFIPICCLDVLTQNCWSNPNLCCKLNAMNVQLGTA